MKSFNNFAFVTFYGILFMLILYKLINVPITHDEVPAALFYSKFSFWQIMMYPDNIPNNHILNTLFTKCCILFFGTEQWAIRLPNLVSFLVFGVGVFRILKRTVKENSYYFLPAAILFVNPYLLDFFSLCRGYGMSSALLTLSVSFLISGYQFSKEKHIWIALFTSIAASYANFTLLVFWSSTTIMVWFYFLKERNGKLREVVNVTILIFLISLSYFALIAVPIYKINSTNELQYWTSRGFYDETILSLIHNWRYGSKVLLQIKSFQIVAFIFIIIGINCSAIFLRLKRISFKLPVIKDPFFVTTMILLLTALINILQTKVLNSPNLSGRTALFFYPLFSSTLISALALLTTTKGRFFIKIFPIIVGIVGLVNLSDRISLKSVKEWEYDQDNLSVVNFLKTQYEAQPISLKTSWFFNPSLSFYKETGKIPWINLYPYDKNIEMNTNARYYYIFAEDFKYLEPRFELAYKFAPDRWLLKQRKF